MRSIHSSESKLKKQRRSQLVIGIVLVGLMVLSTLGYAFSGGGDPEEEGVEKVEYRGVSFVQYGSAWVADRDPQIVLSNNPYNVSQDIFLVNGVSSYSNQPLYIYYNDSLSSFYIYDNFNPFIQRMQQACLSKGCGEGLPVKNCSDNFIIIELSEKSEVLQEDKCVYIRGDQENISKLVDSFVLEAFGLK
tara:strand:+ start:57 stop:626 length:570 start_codon:yes stop_codon:yes gene_type:complete